MTSLGVFIEEARKAGLDTSRVYVDHFSNARTAGAWEGWKMRARYEKQKRKCTRRTP